MEQQRNEQYLSVKQFAERAGCTTQRVYQLLPKRLQPYVIIENGVKYIHEDGLKAVQQARVAQGFDKPLSTVEQPEEPAEPSPELELLRGTVATLTAQLDAKDKQLEALTAALTAAQQIQQQLTAALEASQANQTRLADSLNNAQALHAGTLQTIAVKVSESTQDTPQGSEGNSIPPTPENATSEPPEGNKGIFSKLFGIFKKKDGV